MFFRVVLKLMLCTRTRKYKLTRIETFQLTKDKLNGEIADRYLFGNRRLFISSSFFPTVDSKTVLRIVVFNMQQK